MNINEISSWLSYSPDTGAFVWERSPKPGVNAGDKAGSVTRAGYRRIQLGGRSYRANRLAWLLVTGTWPSGVVDHFDGDRLNDRIGNLRDVSVAENSQNRHGAQRNNKTGILGVCRVGNGYRASIQVNGKKKHIGTFSTPELAQAAREAA